MKTPAAATRHRRPARSNCALRRGAALVEFAFVAPIVFLVVLAGIELSRAHMIYNTIENTAFEGARIGVVPGATATRIETACERMLEAALVRESEITVTPEDIDGNTATIEVNVRVPMDENGFYAAILLRGKSLSRTFTMTREGHFGGTSIAPPVTAPVVTTPKTRKR